MSQGFFFVDENFSKKILSFTSKTQLSINENCNATAVALLKPRMHLLHNWQRFGRKNATWNAWSSVWYWVYREIKIVKNLYWSQLFKGIAIHYFINFIIVILYIISIIRLIFNIHTTIAFQNLKINIVHDFDLYQMKSDHEDSSRWMCILYWWKERRCTMCVSSKMALMHFSYLTCHINLRVDLEMIMAVHKMKPCNPFVFPIFFSSLSDICHSSCSINGCTNDPFRIEIICRKVLMF